MCDGWRSIPWRAERAGWLAIRQSGAYGPAGHLLRSFVGPGPNRRRAGGLFRYLVLSFGVGIREGSGTAWNNDIAVLCQPIDFGAARV